MVYLIALTTNSLSDDTIATLEEAPFPFITLLLMLILGLLSRFTRLHPGSDRRLLVAIPSILAPTAVFGAWTITSSHLAVVAWGGYGYFIDSLSRYPDWGHVNSLVLFALLAELCMAFVPVAVAWAYYLAWPKTVVLTLALISLFAYVALFVEVDLYLYWLGLAPSERELYGFFIYAPLTHSLAIVSVGYLLLSRLRQPELGV